MFIKLIGDVSHIKKIRSVLSFAMIKLVDDISMEKQLQPKYFNMDLLALCLKMSMIIVRDALDFNNQVNY